jgi:gliding motility-associated-like protein
MALEAKPQSNLVPNPSFEAYISCPFTISMIANAAPWNNATLGSPDYFHSCDTSAFTGVPVNFRGHQAARTGSGYAGVYAYIAGGPPYREYIQTPLLAALEKDRKYDVEFYVSLADTVQFAVKTLGLCFSIDSSSEAIPYVSSLIPQINYGGSGHLAWRDGWEKISGVYTASGGERFIIIGNFRSDSASDPVLTDSTAAYPSSYYYIDDVSVSCHDCSELPNVFTPNGDGRNDFIDFSDHTLAEQIVTIYNRWGTMVFESSQSNTRWDGKDLKGNDCSDGVYYYVFHYSDFINTDFNDLNKKGFIQLIR